MGRKSKKFLEEDIEMTKRHMKRYSTSLIIRGTQIKIIASCHLTTVRVAIIKKSTKGRVKLVQWEDEKFISPHS